MAASAGESQSGSAGVGRSIGLLVQASTGTAIFSSTNARRIAAIGWPRRDDSACKNSCSARVRYTCVRTIAGLGETDSGGTATVSLSIASSEGVAEYFFTFFISAYIHHAVYMSI